MVYSGERPRLFVKPHDVLFSEFALGYDHAFERDGLVFIEIMAAVNDAHAPFTQDAIHAIASGDDISFQGFRPHLGCRALPSTRDRGSAWDGGRATVVLRAGVLQICALLIGRVKCMLHDAGRV